jgi:pyruvate, water dikinase
MMLAIQKDNDSNAAELTLQTKLVLWFNECGIADVPIVGGKNASLGEMVQHLAPQGIRIPNGFATTAFAYRQFLAVTGLDQKLRELFVGLVIEDVEQVHQVGQRARALILEASLPDDLAQAISAGYLKLCEQYGQNTDVAVRSSATAEDLPDASFAGQHETFLNVHGVNGLLEACKKCFASIDRKSVV